MPIEIRELHVIAEISSGSEKKKDAKPSPGGNAPAVDQDSIVAECLEKFNRIINKSYER